MFLRIRFANSTKKCPKVNSSNKNKKVLRHFIDCVISCASLSQQQQYDLHRRDTRRLLRSVQAAFQRSASIRLAAVGGVRIDDASDTLSSSTRWQSSLHDSDVVSENGDPNCCASRAHHTHCTLRRRVVGCIQRLMKCGVLSSTVVCARPMPCICCHLSSFVVSRNTITVVWRANSLQNDRTTTTRSTTATNRPAGWLATAAAAERRRT